MTMSISPSARPASDRSRSRPFSRPVRIAMREAGSLAASGAMRREMLADEDFGRRHQRGLGAGLDGGSHGEQRHDGLAGADIALQQPQHAFGLGEVGADFGERELLAAVSCRGGRRGAFRRARRRRSRPYRQAADVRAHQRQRELARQQFVIGEPAPARARRSRVDRRRPDCGCGRARRQSRPGLPAHEGAVQPFGQVGDARERLADDPPQHLAARGRRSSDRPARPAAGRPRRPARYGRDGPWSAGR